MQITVACWTLNFIPLDFAALVCVISIENPTNDI